MFIVESSLPFVARVALAATALMTSGVSTTLVAWCGKPYVVAVRSVPLEEPTSADLEPSSAVQLETSTLLLHPRYTTIYDSAFLKESKRPFAKWELADTIVLKEKTAGGSGEETVAETADAKGNVLGRWIVRWNEDGTTGTCRGVGPITQYVCFCFCFQASDEAGGVCRHFNVHEELLPFSIRQ